MILQGKNAVVTGCSRGIGRAIVECFAENGANVWAHARKETAEFQEFCREVSCKNQVEVAPIYFDMTDDAGMKEAVKTIHQQKKWGGGIDILVNNAGILSGTNAIFLMTKFEDVAQVMNVNFMAAMKFTQLVSKFMIRQKSGSIINISSVAGLYGHPGQWAYAASKSALIGATLTLASEYGGMGIRVNAVAPGLTRTAMADAPEADFRERMVQETMLGRLAEPREIANVAAFLASDLSSYVTGQVIQVNGGLKLL